MTKTRLHRSAPAWLAALACLLGSGLARAQDEAVDSLPGSERPAGVNLSPEAPPTPPAPGGRAPSFGAPVDPNSFVFRLGGRFSAWSSVGFGRSLFEPSTGGDAPWHTPPRVLGSSPVYGGTAARLDFQYGNQLLMASASYEVALTAPEWQGFQDVENGPRLRTAFLTLTPPPMGSARLRFQVGAFPANYGAPGQWGWGVFGPVLAVHGYGGLAALDYELSGEKMLSLEYGTSAVAEVPEGFVRGTFTQWPENGLSSIVHHAHAGISFQNKYFAKLHGAYVDGRNMRSYLDDDGQTTAVEQGADGSIQVAALELRWVEDPYGQIGVTPVFWNFDNARSVHDALWWGLGWTAGGREMTGKHLGPQSEGTGQIAAVAMEYDFSVARMLSYPEPFDGNGRDLRVAVAFWPFWTLETDQASYDGADGYFLGVTVEHVLLSWLSTTYRLYGESRDSTVTDVTANPRRGRWTAYNASFGLALHSDWQSRDKMELLYTRYFYSDFTDNNPVQPLDKEVLTFGASIVF